MTASTTAIEGSSSKPFEEMDALDERQISDEMKGNILSEYFYEIQGKWGLSYAGIKAVAARFAAQGFPISVEHLEIVPSEDGLTYRAIAVAKNLHSGEKRTGAAEVERYLDDAHTRPKPFAYTLAGSKAQRNAIRHFLPETVIQEAYAEFKGQSKPRDVTKEAKVTKSFIGSKPVE